MEIVRPSRAHNRAASKGRVQFSAIQGGALLLISFMVLGGLSSVQRFSVGASLLQESQTINWTEQGITWSAPADWSKVNATDTFVHWKSPGTWDAASLMVNVSPLGPSFPVEVSRKAMWDAAALRQKNNEITDLGWLELDGVKGLRYRENPPQNLEDVRRLQWQGYRKHGGQVKLVNIIISTQGKSFDKHQETMYAVLNSTKIVK